MLPADVSGRITFFYERALTSTVEGIERLQSHSYYGSSIIFIYLHEGIDLAGAEAEITAISQTVTNTVTTRHLTTDDHATGALLGSSGHDAGDVGEPLTRRALQRLDSHVSDRSSWSSPVRSYLTPTAASRSSSSSRSIARP